MKLTYFRGSLPNFGDELNVLLWRHLLPAGFLDDATEELFLGIGSIIFDFYPEKARKIVAGAGFAGYTSIPNVHDGTWEILWVRGPITAQKLSLDERLAIADAAILLRAIPLPDPTPGIDIAFMPHVDSLLRSRWDEVCRLAGVTFLDPTAAVETLLAHIRGARLVITEAMHGAIVSDALRTPWIGIMPFNMTHREKWLDWAGSLQIPLHRHKLGASSMAEVWTKLSGRQAVTGKSSRYLAAGPSEPLNRVLRYQTAEQLKRMADLAEPQLSSDSVITVATERALATLDSFVRARRTIVS